MINNLFQKLKEDPAAKVFLTLACIALAILIFAFSGGIVESIFDCGVKLGSAIRNACGW